jgi:hypothetical protein
MRNARLFKIEDKIIQFILGLNDRHQGVRSQVLLMEQVPSIKKFISMVLQVGTYVLDVGLVVPNWLLDTLFGLMFIDGYVFNS